MINLENIKHIHFVGIGGVSMSALAKLMSKEGKIISGSDDVIKKSTEKMKKSGFNIKKHSNRSGVINADLVVYTSAIPQSHADIVLAKHLKKPIIERAEFLSMVTKKYKTTVAVSGTHGKTTTTAMLAEVLEKFSPTVHVGGESSFGNLKIGKKEFFITEACEFNKSFLSLKPNVAVILNIEKDHMECYQDFDDLIASFAQFINKTSDFVVINHNFLHFFTPFLTKKKFICSDVDKKSDYWATNLTEINGCFSFDFYADNFHFGNIKLSVFGRHNVYNAVATIATALELGISFQDIKTKIENFKSVKRRFEFLLDQSVKVVHDYAHHPTEIKSAISTAKLANKNGRVICIFQPHTFSRTEKLLEEFLTCFGETTSLVLIPTFKAREEEKDGLTSKQLFEKLEDNLDAVYFDDLAECAKHLLRIKKDDDLFLFLGAGDIDEFAKNFAKILKKQ